MVEIEEGSGQLEFCQEKFGLGEMVFGAVTC